MDCREFRNKHVAYVDDLLPAFEMDAMQRHLTNCSGCSRQDTRVRRSLMLVHNLPPIEASPEFMQRLNARLTELGPVSRNDVVVSRSSRQSLAAFAALAAGLAAVAYMSVETSNYYAPQGELEIASADAFASALALGGSAPITNAALVASVPTGIPVWPAVIMAGQVPMHFASMDFRDSEQTR